MKINKKLGYTLAEIMVVLLVLSIIFAAFAPLITKRHASSSRSKYAVWNWTSNSRNDGNAYFDPGKGLRGAAFFGVTPESSGSVDSIYFPHSSYARVVIRSLDTIGNGSNKDIQRQIQFRYGAAGINNTTGRPESQFTGSWLMDKKNILLGGKFNRMKPNSEEKYNARNNIAIGYGALENLSNGTTSSEGNKDNIAIGYNAGNSYSYNDNVIIGALAGTTSRQKNTFIGAMSGQNNAGSSVTAIGYNTVPRGSYGTSNTIIGANAGQNITSGNYNLAVGYNALGNVSSGSHNVAIGSNALSSLQSGSYNVALGANACSGVTTGSYKTCIGENSGPTYGTYSETYIGARSDSQQRTYIGSKPIYFGGDAVMEIHNVNTMNPKLVNDPQIHSNVTTVINGNLIVRGRLFMTSGNTLWKLSNHISVSSSGTGTASGLGVKDNDFAAYRCTSDQATYDWRINAHCPVLTGTSDRRLKNIGSRNTDGLNKISQLKVFKYNFKSDKDKHPQVGVIAQELQKVFPNAVVQGEDGYLKIRWDEMFYASVNALKELDKKIILLTKRITNLEPKITKLEQQNTELKLEVAQLSARVEKLKNK